MINAIHTLIYADDAETARDFFRNVVQWPFVDTGGGWLIFKTGPSEMGIHPTSQGDWSTPQKHEISFVCDDLEATMTDLRSRGATFAGDVVELDFGKTVQLEVPGGPQVMLYEPHYDPPALTL